MCVSYRQQQTAVLLQSPQESQEGHTGDDDAADQQDVCYAEFGQGWGERHLEVHHQVHAKAQNSHTTHLRGQSAIREMLSAPELPTPATTQAFRALPVIFLSTKKIQPALTHPVTLWCLLHHDRL